MFQTEVARRIVASPGSKDYGALSIGIDYYAKAEVVLHLSPNQFYPVPKVSSSLVKLTLRPQPKVLVKDEVLFFQLVRSAFQFRRKMLRNAIENGCINLDMEQMNRVFTILKIDSNRRGETLYISEFAEIANTFTATTG
jgi:16S rRNA (adenine1518-N6/adenine1519-N6)-dimethyltransferase